MNDVAIWRGTFLKWSISTDISFIISGMIDLVLFTNIDDKPNGMRSFAPARRVRCAGCARCSKAGAQW